MAIPSTAPARPHAFDALSARLAGELITPGHRDYDAGRRIWNGMIDKRPAAIARCTDADDVALASRFAAERGLPLAVRGGGHNVASTAVVEDGPGHRPGTDQGRVRPRERLPPQPEHPSRRVAATHR